MNNAETAREIALEALKELGGQEPISESWLVQNSYVIGRRFCCEEVSAVWLFETDEVKIYDQTGKVVRVVALTETKKAA